MARREFSPDVRREIVRRSMRPANDGRMVVCCEQCHLVEPKAWAVDHTIPDALFLDKTRKLIATDGRVLCADGPESCHGIKTRLHDQPTIAKTKRNEDSRPGQKHVGRQPEIRSAPMATTPKAAARAARGHRPSVIRTHDIFGRPM